MPPSSPRLRILSVGGNAVSAFLSWRLQATNACDVTLVWKTGYESVAQFGISFRSTRYGNERFKPKAVVRSPEDAVQGLSKGSFDYVLLCVKALPDVYDLASVIEPVVTPQHTCILINTSNSLGVETAIEERFPKNVVLSIVSEADINQLGPAEFEHLESSDLWVGPANVNSNIPVTIQSDMAEALAMTLASGQVECRVSKNIQQQQFERMVGPISFHTTSVLFECPNLADLLDLPGVRPLLSDAMDEVMRIGEAKGCKFASGFKEQVMEQMIAPKETPSGMYQDYASKRPMEVETYLGAPIKIAKTVGIKTPRLETLYAMLHHVNVINQRRLSSNEGSAPAAAPRVSSMAPPPRNAPMNGGPRPPFPNGMPGRGSRAPSMTGPPPMNPGRRMTSGYGPNGMAPPRGPGQLNRHPSFEQSNGLDEFSHVVLYDTPEESFQDLGSPYSDNGGGALGMRERELMLRQKELALREREMALSGRPGPRARRPSPGQFDDDDDDGEDYFDPMAYRGPPVDPDTVDMMSITSRRTRKQGSIGGQVGPPPRRGMPFGRPGMNRNRASSSRTLQDMPGLHNNVTEDPLFAYADNRYGAVDRREMGAQSRTNSLTAARLDELQHGSAYGGYPPMNRRTSHSPGTAFGVGRGGRGGYSPNGVSPHRRPSPPEINQPMPRPAPGHGNGMGPQGMDQRAGVSTLYPPKSGPQVRSLTGSASASAGSGDSGRSAHNESGNSAYSSQTSLGPRPAIGVR